MTMLGKTVTRNADGEEFTITGADHRGSFVLSPVIFGSPVGVTIFQLVNEYDVNLDEIRVPLSEIEIQNGVHKPQPAPEPAAPYAPPPGSPEAVFAVAATEDE